MLSFTKSETPVCNATARGIILDGCDPACDVIVVKLHSSRTLRQAQDLEAAVVVAVVAAGVAVAV